MHTILAGVVYDVDSRQPVAGAALTVEDGDLGTETRLSDSEGKYRIESSAPIPSRQVSSLCERTVMIPVGRARVRGSGIITFSARHAERWPKVTRPEVYSILLAFHCLSCQPVAGQCRTADYCAVA